MGGVGIRFCLVVFYVFVLYGCFGGFLVGFLLCFCLMFTVQLFLECVCDLLFSICV